MYNPEEARGEHGRWASGAALAHVKRAIKHLSGAGGANDAMNSLLKAKHLVGPDHPAATHIDEAIKHLSGRGSVGMRKSRALGYAANAASKLHAGPSSYRVRTGRTQLIGAREALGQADHPTAVNKLGKALQSAGNHPAAEHIGNALKELKGVGGSAAGKRNRAKQHIAAALRIM